MWVRARTVVFVLVCVTWRGRVLYKGEHAPSEPFVMACTLCVRVLGKQELALTALFGIVRVYVCASAHICVCARVCVCVCACLCVCTRTGAGTWEESYSVDIT